MVKSSMRSLVLTRSWTAIILLICVACNSTGPTVSSPLPLPTTAAPATSTAAPSLTPTTQILPTATASVTPVPQLQWISYGSSIQAGDSCDPSLPAGAFTLGIQPGTCLATDPGHVTTGFSVPPNPQAQTLVIHIQCVGPAGCAQATRFNACTSSGCVDSPTETISQGLSVSVNGQIIWQADCGPVTCGPNPPAREIMATYVVPPHNDSQNYSLQLQTLSQVSWSIANVRLEWLPLPDLIQGVAYSPFRDCQNPNWGPFPTEDQIQADLVQLRHVGNAIRTYSSAGVAGSIPALARKQGLRVSAGAWLGRDKTKNEEEIQSLIQLAQTVDLDSVIVGNEVLLRNDLTEDELITYIERVRQAVPVPVTTAEIGSVLLQHPRVIASVDYLLVHLYAFWDGVPIENAARYVVERYQAIQAQYQDQNKKVVIGETGWPSSGPAQGLAIPSPENQRRFYEEFLSLAQKDKVEFYYFDYFDELWKTEGGVGAYWGLTYSNRVNKYDSGSLLAPFDLAIPTLSPITPMPSTTPGAIPASGDQFYIFNTYASAANHFAPSGWMGDIPALHFTDCRQLGDTWEDRVVEVQYAPGPSDPEGWAGIYWQEPENNWGDQIGGYDLTGYTQLRFRAKTTGPAARVQFFIGGTRAQPYPSSVLNKLYPQEADGRNLLHLNGQWQEFHIDLRRANLKDVIDGFGLVFERKLLPEGTTIDLDDILFDHELAPVRSTAEPPVILPSATPFSSIPGGPGEPAIGFTAVPPLGSFDNLQGQVLHVDPRDYRVAVYIQVEGGWWSKPYWNTAATPIRSDGTFTCDITTGGIDEQATTIAAYLIPANVPVPLASGGGLPASLEQISPARTTVNRNP